MNILEEYEDLIKDIKEIEKRIKDTGKSHEIKMELGLFRNPLMRKLLEELYLLDGDNEVNKITQANERGLKNLVLSGKFKVLWGNYRVNGRHYLVIEGNDPE